MNTTIIQAESEILRHDAAPVAPEEFGTTALNDVVDQLKNALHDTPDGVAIAAPQVGISQRIFVVAGAVYQHNGRPEYKNTDASPSPPDKVFINPQITKHAKEVQLMEEGCLSVRPYYGKVPRYTKVTVRAQDPAGNVFSEGRGGLLAQIFQHEIDHLNGVLFTDKAQGVEYRGENADTAHEK